MGSITQEDIYNKTVARQITTVADATGSMNLLLWDKFVSQLQVNSFYKISVNCRNYDNTKIKLTTTPSTEICQIDEIENINVQPIGPEEIVTVGEVKQIIIVSKFKCSACKKPTPKSPTKFTKCTNCNMRQMTEDLLKSGTWNINVLNEEKVMLKLTAFETIAADYMLMYALDSLSTDELEENLLGVVLKIKYVNDVITSMDKLE